MVYVEATDWVLCEVGTELSFITYLKLCSKFCSSTRRRRLGTSKHINAPSVFVVVLDRQVLARVVLKGKGN